MVRDSSGHPGTSAAGYGNNAYTGTLPCKARVVCDAWHYVTCNTTQARRALRPQPTANPIQRLYAHPTHRVLEQLGHHLLVAPERRAVQGAAARLHHQPPVVTLGAGGGAKGGSVRQQLPRRGSAADAAAAVTTAAAAASAAGCAAPAGAQRSAVQGRHAHGAPCVDVPAPTGCQSRR